MNLDKILIFSLCLISFVGFAEANPNYIHVGIELSESCNSLISIGDLETCQSYPYLNSLYPEVTVKPSFQKLIETAEREEKTSYQMNNILLNHKYQCVTRDYCNIFDIDKTERTLFWFSPDMKFRDNLDILIKIHPSLLQRNIDKTIEPITLNNSTNQREISFEINQVFIYPSCRIADYTPEYMLGEIGFLLWYMFDNCRDEKQLGSLATPDPIELDTHVLDITTSPNYQAQQKLKADLERCKTKC